MSTVTEKVMKTERPTSLETVRTQILAFGDQIREYLDKVEANVEEYKFSVAKAGDGVEIEVQFKALIHPKSAASKIIPK